MDPHLELQELLRNKQEIKDKNTMYMVLDSSTELRKYKGKITKACIKNCSTNEPKNINVFGGKAFVKEAKAVACKEYRRCTEFITGSTESNGSKTQEGLKCRRGSFKTQTVI